MFLLRSAQPADLPALLRLAAHLDSVNLPHDVAALEALVALSQVSFAERGRPRSVEPPLPPVGVAQAEARPARPGTFLFVLASDTGDVLGTSLVVAEHGTPADPHHFLRLAVEERYSPRLQRVFRHQLLTLGRSFSPHTELGGLVLDPRCRRSPQRLGRAIAMVRFLFLLQHRPRFCDVLQAELLPPLEPDGTSRLWEYLGRPFTGLSYQEADRLSREDRLFITHLFPSVPLYTALMPPALREVLGAVGPETRPVEHMLRQLGFTFQGHIDPFDGGPHLEARLDELPLRGALRTFPCEALLRASGEAPAGEEGAAGQLWLVTLAQADAMAGWLALLCAGTLERPVLDARAVEQLGAARGDALLALPLLPSTR